MRALRWHRIFTVCWVFPLFSLMTLWNNLWLGVDWLIFPKFRRQQIVQPVFVVSLPRTGTTNLLHGLTDSGMPFTALALWESLLAPSVVQKKVLRLAWRVMPTPMRNLVRRADRRLLDKLNAIHKVSLFSQEEDELALMWSWSTAYMAFFYPESEVFRDVCRFDAEVSERRKARIMRRYKRLVQRHLHALPQGHGLRFMAKNPLMASKVQALSTAFPDARAIVIDRDPRRVLPSSEVLMKHLLTFSTDVPLQKAAREEFLLLLEDFQHHLHHTLATQAVMPTVVVPFDQLIRDRHATLGALVRMLGEQMGSFTPPQKDDGHHTAARYTPWTSEELDSVLTRPWPMWPDAMCLQHEPAQAPNTAESQDPATPRG